MMTDLIERIESAAEGCEELDVAIAAELSSGNETVYEFAQKWWTGGIPHYTTSVDAALTWERVVEVRYDYQIGQWVATHDAGGGSKGRFVGFGHTEPLARRAAALRARES